MKSGRKAVISGICMISMLTNLWSAPARADWKESSLDVWRATKDKASQAWEYSKDTVADTAAQAGQQVKGVTLRASSGVSDAAKATWAYASGQADECWDWVRSQTGSAVEWAEDKSTQSWLITKEASGEASLWMKQSILENGAVVWTRTTLPAGWTWTKDASGTVWVWVKEHKVQVTTVLVVGAIWAAKAFLAPDSGNTAADAPIRIDREYEQHRGSLGGLSEPAFTEISRKAIADRATQNTYRNVYSRLQPIRPGAQLHHAYPQEYRGIMTENGVNIDNSFNLRDVLPETHVQVTNEWAAWGKSLGRTPSANEIKDFSRTLDAKYGDRMQRLPE